MGTIKSMKVRNLRSFPNENDFFDIKKVNLLVGKNSSGKSSFLRLFPLLRQSFEETTTGPILWFGKYVDFGDFDYALNKNLSSNNAVIYFDFKLTVDVIPEFDDMFPFEVERGEENLYKLNRERRFQLEVELSLGVESMKGTSRACYVSIKTENCVFEMNLGHDRNVVSLNSFNCLTDESFKSKSKLYYSNSEFVPEIYEMTEDNEKEKVFMRGYRLPSDAHEAFVDYLQGVIFKKERRTIDKELKSLSFTSKEKYIDNMKKYFKFSSSDFYKEGEKNNEIASDIYMYLLVGNINSVVEGINRELKSFFSSIRYLGPVRATAERFYRYQDLRVNEIDHMGENLPMVINSLKTIQRKRLEVWMLENFGFSLKLESTGSHMAIMIKEESEEDSYNISDMGFGYSQLLPIVVSIWMQINRIGQSPHSRFLGNKKEQIIVIEQPELHLHPEMQYRFAQAIIKIVSMSDSSNIRFIFETHSKHMIDAFGHSIQDGNLDNEFINIAIFNKRNDKCTYITTSGFDEDGYLENWPVGFLSA